MGRQQELLERSVRTGTPVILIVVSGRPLALPWAAQHCAAVLLAWVPGDAGPDAIADVIVGVENPGGKLPVTMLRDVGQVPLTYRHHPSGGRSNPRGDHVDGKAGPLWPFGHGLSYTTFEFSALRLDDAQVPTHDGSTVLRVSVTNTGDRTGDEVVQVYARDEEAGVARPVLELCGFLRVSLAAGETKELVFELHADLFSHTGRLSAHRRTI
jgi:beta-glucosidase